jgi:hypothetical protein
MPFRDAEGEFMTGDGRGALLRQVTTNAFSLEEPFSFDRAGDDGVHVDVEPRHLQSTDLASIPGLLRWFVPRYGRHTLAALMHDQLVKSGVDNPAEIPDRRSADKLFYTSMADLDVGLVRRQIMWAAVTLRTRWGTPWLRPDGGYGWFARVGLLGWLLAAILGISSFWVGTLSLFGVGGVSVPAALVIAVLLPLFAMWLWGRDWQQGLVATYGLVIVVLPSVLAAIFYRIYSLAEAVVSILPIPGVRTPTPMPDSPSDL